MNNLRDIRRKRCLSQADLSQLSGVTEQTIVSIEKGRHYPKFVTIRKLALALKVDVEELKFE